MDIQKLKSLIQNGGVVGVGGAGFPTYVKLDERANSIIMNCAECEPLLKLHRQLLKVHAFNIMKTFQLIADLLGAEEAIIGIKHEYSETIEAMNMFVNEFPKVRIHLLQSVYPMGDEIVLIYETTKKVVRPGGLPIEEGIVVFNVETIYNIFRLIEEEMPVVDKVVSVVAEVENPITVRVPIGVTIEEVVNLAGKVTTKDAVYLVGGPMMGNISSKDDVVTKTTNAILVLPKNHHLIKKKVSNPRLDIKRAASICCQCEMCTDLCPRNALGHPIEPHLFMRACANKDFQNIDAFLNTFFCSSCGTCELYSCPQGLSPRTLIAEYKNGLRKAGLKPPKAVLAPVNKSREYRKTPEERLEARLGIGKYNLDAPLNDVVVQMDVVKILLRQHIGAPALPIVQEGDFVKRGQMVGRPAEGLSVSVHASIDGRVIEVTNEYVKICNNHPER